MKLYKYSIIFEDIFGLRIRLHWTILASMIVFGGSNFQPIYYLSFLILICIHEIGHAIVVKAYSFRNHELIIHGFGGACIWSGAASQKQMSIIAWGGILAQLSIFIVFLILPKLTSLPHYSFLDEIFRAFIGTNLFLITINLIPYEPLDGAQAWKLFESVLRDFKSLKNRQINKKKSLKKMKDSDFHRS